MRLDCFSDLQTSDEGYHPLLRLLVEAGLSTGLHASVDICVVGLIPPPHTEFIPRTEHFNFGILVYILLGFQAMEIISIVSEYLQCSIQVCRLVSY